MQALLWPRLSAGLLLTAALFLPATAQAYCRTTTCDASKQDCSPSSSGCVDQGLPLYWAGQCVGYWLQKDADSPSIPMEVFSRVTDASFDAWMQTSCEDGQPPSIQATNMGPISCDAVEYNQRGGNANILMFRTKTWPYRNSANTLALTTVTFNTQTGEIYDVDMEINAADVELTVSDTNVKYDLQSIITHEAGHFLGLAHSPDSTATMYPSYPRGKTSLRTLAPDDTNGICAVYPSDRTASACDTTPRHGFQDICGERPATTDDSKCSVSVAGSSASFSGSWLAVSALTLGLLAARRRCPKA